jgi:hypothetical protein
MTTPLPAPSGGRTWTDLYKAALVEADCNKLPQRIAEAQQALIARAGELFLATGDHIEEESALDDAMYALHALQNACRRDKAAIGAGESSYRRMVVGSCGDREKTKYAASPS